MTERPAGRLRRPVPAPLPAAAGAAAALLALSTLGLTWVRRSVEGPLGEAGAAQVEQLTGREVAPVVAALVPATAAAVVLALLLRGRWRAVALALGAVSALGAGVAALGPVLGTPAGQGRTTAVPLLAATACLVAAASALVGVVLTLRAPGADPDGATAGPDAGTTAAPGDHTGTASGPGTAAGGVTAAGPGTAAGGDGARAGGADHSSLWHALDEGRDPTDARD